MLGLLGLSLSALAETRDDAAKGEGVAPPVSAAQASPVSRSAPEGADASDELDDPGDPAARIDRLSRELAALRDRVEVQQALLQRLAAQLEPDSPKQPEAEAAASRRAAQEECERRIAELNARLQQQQLRVDEAQRRAEKAEKLAAALDEAEARATTEIERLRNALETAKARRAESLQQAVELQRRLASAEARLERLNGRIAGKGAGQILGIESRPVAEQSAPSASSAGTEVDFAAASVHGQPGAAAGKGSATVRYEVRPDDTLSDISQRFYGAASAWERIYEANRDLLPRPEALRPGMSLVIPLDR